VYKAMELLPLGPVMIIDTPGFDDEGRAGRAPRAQNPADPEPHGHRRAGRGRFAAGMTLTCDRQLVAPVPGKTDPLADRPEQDGSVLAAPAPDAGGEPVPVSALTGEGDPTS
jgi:hypothetical protein